MNATSELTALVTSIAVVAIFRDRYVNKRYKSTVNLQRHA